MQLKPLNNHVLVEVDDPYAGLSKPQDDSQSMQKGKVIEAAISAYHLTMSTGFRMDSTDMQVIQRSIADLIGKDVYWQEHADVGQRFTSDDGKRIFALIPFWRLIAFEDSSKTPASKVAKATNKVGEKS